jgi:hypothetical protein
MKVLPIGFRVLPVRPKGDSRSNQHLEMRGLIPICRVVFSHIDIDMMSTQWMIDFTLSAYNV